MGHPAGRFISSLSARHFAGTAGATIYGGIYSANAIGAAAGALTAARCTTSPAANRARARDRASFCGAPALPFWVRARSQEFPLIARRALLALAQRAAAQVGRAFLGHDHRRPRSSASRPARTAS